MTASVASASWDHRGMALISPISMIRISAMAHDNDISTSALLRILISVAFSHPDEIVYRIRGLRKVA